VRAVAFPIQANPQVLATGGAEKKLRIFDLTRGSGGGSGSNASTPPIPSGGANPATENGVASYEIGAGVHGGTIKSIVWNQDYNVVTTRSAGGICDPVTRWWSMLLMGRLGHAS
jgi:serine-threonine kinase receptor-associated protein